ncbi:Acetyltransferase (GNAT) family protein [Brevibacterium siliguriense]|uniref:Acetyltransferase (GNAT) family protein n=1 Tax=Brevibacterium siliguriense TaxID=1136497 RepID=A0A1H1WRW1_9MICO|nr:GNAT family N-acetyltransferase [Brevibacterium siliguriense]SDS98929.1 Acetyltransferase (GNAT) family protein [Brevibacterium siliguriense]
MEITRIGSGLGDPAAIEALMPELLAFDTVVNRASGLGADFDPIPEDLRHSLTSTSRYRTTLTWIGRIDGVIVAKGVAELRLTSNTDTAEVWCGVHPDHRRRGLGSALLTVMENELRAEGRTALSSYCEIPESVRVAELRGAHLPTETGAGTLPVAVPEVAFLHRRGYGFAQIERCAVAPTATAAGLDLGADADDYVIETWRGPVPEQRLEHIALLKRRMSTDTPGAERFGGEESWDGERVSALDEEKKVRGEEMATALALLDGEPAGFTQVGHSADRPAVGWQGGTLVRREHRGHRLGARLKVANHRSLAERTAVERVYTWNAVENSWMLAINDQAGFSTWAWVGLWTKNRR